jgi:acyl-CoA synthetase (AMP-forming)/AMP-acid ligase II
MTGRNLLLYDVLASETAGTIYDSDRESIAFIQFSSGSTGNPKGVTLTHGNILTNMDAIITGVNAVEEDSTLSWMPLTHDMGLIGFHLTPLAAGINQCLMPTEMFIRCPALWLDKADEHRATMLSSPNFGLGYLLSNLKENEEKKWDLSNVRILFNGAEPVSGEVCNKFLDALEPYGLKRNVMFPVYGLAEACLAVTFPPVEEEAVAVTVDRRSLITGSTVIEFDNRDNTESMTLTDLGYPVKGCSVRICDEENLVLPDNVVGHVQIYGDNVTKGYYNDEEATNEIVKGGGWLDTGDLGFFRNGRLIVAGRAKDVIFVNEKTIMHTILKGLDRNSSVLTMEE